MKVEIERVLNATPEKLYKMWTDSTLISAWLGVKTEIEPKVGGFLKVDFGEKELTTGMFKELDPFNKVSFTWHSFNQDIPSGETLVTVTFKPEHSGKTKMKLVHTGFQTELAFSEHNSGWNEYFTGWEKKLEK
jgi:uncharacterized protein YndB with AHSA1/START domain